jgi:hypothetical protein
MKEFKLLDLKEGKILEWFDIRYLKGEIIFIKTDNAYIREKTPLSQSTHTKLIPILEKTGAELFGDRYVLFNIFEDLTTEDITKFEEFCELVK